MKYLSLAVVLIPFFYGCKDCTRKQVTCPGYQEPTANWFPYMVNQKLVFRFNGINDTITLGIIDASGSYRSSVSASNAWCTAQKQWMSTEKAAPGIMKFVMTSMQRTDAYNGTSQENDWYINLRGSQFSGNGISDTGLIRKPSIPQTSQYYQLQVIGGTTYPMVQMVMTDTSSNKTQGIYKIWLAKNNGLIAYEEYPSRNLWIKQ